MVLKYLQTAARSLRRQRPYPAGNDTAPSGLSREVAAVVRHQLSGILQRDESIELAVAADIRSNGRFGEAWLLATDRQLIGYAPNGDRAANPVCIPLNEIRRIELLDFTGSGALRVHTAQRGTTIVRFSRTLASTFAEVPKQIDALVRRARLVDEGAHITGSNLELERARPRCERCRRVVPGRGPGGRGVVCRECQQTPKLLLRLVGYIRPHWRLACASLLLMVAATGIGLSPQLLMRTLIDDVLITQPGRDLTRIAGFMQGTPRTLMLYALVVGLFFAHVLGNGLGGARRYLVSRLGQGVTHALRNQVYRHLHTLSLSFYNERQTGGIMASITQDVGRLQNFISDGLQELVRDILTIAIIVIILFALNPTLALLVLLPTPVLVFLTLRFNARWRVATREVYRRWAGISALLADTIPGVRVVKAFAQEQREVAKFEHRSEGVFNGELQSARIQSVFSPVIAFLTSVGNMLIWWVGGEQVLGEALSLGTFTAFTAYMWQFYGPVENLCQLNLRFQRAAASAERVFATLDAQPEVRDSPNAQPLPPIKGRVQFCDVTFGYTEGPAVLRHIDLDVAPGEMIGLAGHSGAGKSTLINLICRLYDVVGGQILIDGDDIRTVRVKSLRDQIGVVLQDPFLFNGTIAENIAYGKPEASSSAVVAAARAAHAHDFVMKLPDGYDTPTGERGVRLSGGERQRISIARAILRDPRILILDEATSSVDTETEVKIQEALARLIKGRTTFAIAHRLSTLRHASRLLILDKGVIAEVGTHDQLIAAAGIYARLCRLQTETMERRAW